jgi:RNA exonuclease 1
MSHTVVLLVPGLLVDHIAIPPTPLSASMPFSTAPLAGSSSKIPAIQELFSYGLPTRAPGDQRRMFSVLDTLLRSPLPDSLRRKEEETKKKLASAYHRAVYGSLNLR